VVIAVSAGWALTINAFPPRQILKEYWRAEAMGDAAGVLSCTVVEIKQIYSGTSVHERPCLRTIQFTNKFSEQKSLG
jgi:hypothetical protein